MIIGFKHKRIGQYSCGIEFGLRENQEVAYQKKYPYFEIFCFRLVGIPDHGGFNKQRDIRGFWRVMWYQRAIQIEADSKIMYRKGFRPYRQRMKGVARGKFRLW